MHWRKTEPPENERILFELTTIGTGAYIGTVVYDKWVAITPAYRVLFSDIRRWIPVSEVLEAIGCD